MSPPYKISHDFIPQRWVFAILASTGICLQNMFASIMPITIIEMVRRTENQELGSESCSNVNNDNPTNNIFFISQMEDHGSIGRYSWDEYTQGIILSSFAWSSTIGQFFYGTLAERFGGKHILGFGILAQAIITFITPFIVNWGGSNALIISRVMVGLATDGLFSVVSTMIPHWSTPSERTKIGNTIFAGTVLGVFFGTIMPALIMTYSGMGWSAVFYFIGLVGMIWFPLWLTFVHENPEIHPYISEQEFQYLRNVSIEKKLKNYKLPSPPWRQIFLNQKFWSFTISYMGANCVYYVMVSGLPRYMGNVVKFSIESNGYFSSLPYIFMWLNSLLSAWISDKILEKQLMSLTNVRKLFTIVSVTGPGIFILLASYAECDKTIVVIMFVLAMAIFGGIYTSLFMNPIDLSPNYAGSITSMGSGIASSIGILAPYLIGILVTNSTFTEWRLVFWIVLSFASFSSAVYLFWFKAEVQPWNDTDFFRKEIRNPEGKENVELKLIS